jgi:uncharacterized protein YcbK (DUF882 family)
MRLTDNFTLEEFTRSSTADRLGIVNVPGITETGHIRMLCETILQPARNALGPIQVLSGFRSERLNQAVGGVPHSAHQLGYAADIVPVRVSKIELARTSQL